MTLTSIWPIIACALLALAAGIGQPYFGVALLVWGGLALYAGLWSREDAAGAESEAAAPGFYSSWRPVSYFGLLALPALIAGRPEIGAMLAAPLAALLLASLLNQHDTARAARSWAIWIGLSLWALAGTASLALLTPWGTPWSAALIVPACLAGYNAARRAVIIQGRPRTWSHTGGTVVAALGASLLATPDLAPVYLFCVVLGLLLYYATEHVIPPALPRASATARLADMAVHVQHQIVCVAPLTLIVLWSMDMLGF